jgi:hypothetical protein
MYNQFQKVLNMVKKTGDRIVVLDNNAGKESAYVIMNLDDYEKMVVKNSEVANLTEEELLDKINRDIAVWKSQQDYFKPESAETDDHLPDFNPKSFEPISFSERPAIKKKRWEIPWERKEAAEEIIEEDRQYLEEIAF